MDDSTRVWSMNLSFLIYECLIEQYDGSSDWDRIGIEQKAVVHRSTIYRQIRRDCVVCRGGHSYLGAPGHIRQWGPFWPVWKGAKQKLSSDAIQQMRKPCMIYFKKQYLCMIRFKKQWIASNFFLLWGANYKFSKSAISLGPRKFAPGNVNQCRLLHCSEKEFSCMYM